ncbi:adenosine deaminase [Beutenbergia cavernae DSM 12333]|uniref:Adenosine deaminase n=1 Tax=Beutenbergia cavernae (strain ATCC BAA-8 / DSM 12333 / CCUG 43141 / JCM 11478 / NBRC 16432 / NCIMB 13614 / HKI 0122) TaxID=471853 RepID=C5C0M1_BEUC1|nr:adenosine deaminase [Beutenbergia cavernae]ACQ81417.1 adenosine deaminase [Beutenbergia cavernae DSM 12333]
MRDLATLPKAHLHLHFTGSMRVATLRDLAHEQGIRLPESLLDHDPLRVPADERGWFRFQRSYDAARAVVRSEAAMRRVLREAVEDDGAEGSRRLEIQIDPTSYAPFVGGLTPALEIVLDEARAASAATGVSVGVVVACSRMRHPLEARTLARLAARYAGDAPGEVVGFGLSNDERRGRTSEFAPAFGIAARAGLASVPHGGELLGADHVRVVLAELAPRRLGHGVRASEDPRLLEAIASAGVACEVCPASNVSLGVYADVASVPLRTLLDAGVRVALGADDPLLFLSRLVDQYEAARTEHGLDDAALAGLARSSIAASLAPQPDRSRWLAEVDAWLATPAPDGLDASSSYIRGELALPGVRARREGTSSSSGDRQLGG